MAPVWVYLWSFHSSRFYCLTCGNLKKKKKRRKEGIKNERKWEERMNEKRKKDRKEEGIKKKKKPSAGFKPAKPVLLAFLAATG